MKLKGCIAVIAAIVLIISGLCYLIHGCQNQTPINPSHLGNNSTTTSETVFAAFVQEHGLSDSDYPPELLKLLETNPEAQEFVLYYPLYKNRTFEIDLNQCCSYDSVPLFLQWDKRWGYQLYGDQIMGLTGCGPTCLSMVAVYLLQDTNMNPAWMAEFSSQNGYCLPGNGTAWTLMSNGARQLGLNATELPLDKNRIIRNLKAGNPIICIMGAGDFTTSGHFIVLTGWQDGKITVNDPNSKMRSQQLYDYEHIKDQIRNLWVYTV